LHGISFVRGSDSRIIMLLSTVAPIGTADKIIKQQKELMCLN